MDCYERCLCATCVDNDDCPGGCDMCQQMQACRFIIAHGKCKSYKPDAEAARLLALAAARRKDSGAQ